MVFFVFLILSSLKVTDYLHTMTPGQDMECVYLAPLITWTMSNVYLYKPKEQTPGPRETKLKKRLVDVNPRRPRMYIDTFWRFLSKEKKVPPPPPTMTYSGTKLKTRSVCVWSNAFYILCVRQSKDGPIRRPVGHAIKMAPITIVPSARGDRDSLAAVVGQRRGKRGRSPDD